MVVLGDGAGIPELSIGWVDPWVGLGWVGLGWIESGRVGSNFFSFWWVGWVGSTIAKVLKF